MSISSNLAQIESELPEGVTLVAVSKTMPENAILEAYRFGQRIFGENRVQELTSKYESLPKDIEWHMIGHLQSNKIKYIAPFVSMIHGIDSLKLLREVDKQAEKSNRIIPCLLQVHIAQEETKFGFDAVELEEALVSGEIHNLKNIKVKGLMGMATFTDDEDVVKSEFTRLKMLFDKYRSDYGFDTLSMGMSGDYKMAIECGSNMVRIGSHIFGVRN